MLWGLRVVNVKYPLNMEGASVWGLALFGLAAVAWFSYFRAKNRGRSSALWLAAAATGGGFGAVLPALLGFVLVGGLNLFSLIGIGIYLFVGGGAAYWQMR